MKHFEILIHAFVTNRLDYCNALYAGLDEKLLHRLQMVQNAAARLLTGTKKREHITPILKSLHWLPLRFRIASKILLFVFKCLHGLAPQYLTELVQPYVPARFLRSADLSWLVTPKSNKRRRGINCVTFPSPACMPEQQLLKPNEWSYCDYFWTDKKDPQGSGCITGFEILLQKQLKGKQMQKEMAEFIRERIKIEEEYAKNLSKLSQIPLAGQEEGTLGEAWAQLKKSLADEAEVHLKFSSKLQSEVEKPFLTFRENFKKDMKRFDHHIADLRKQLVGRYAAVEKARKALADRQKELELKTQQLEIKLSNKIEEDIKKARRKSTQAGDDLMRCVDLYNQSQSKWFEEMVTTSLELERLEVERVEMIRQHLCQYTTLRHETDMFNQSTMEPVVQLLQCVDPSRDRELWVRENKTGEIRPVDVEI
uniref:Growth arrest specific 7 n=1 Tax=Amphiprion percula TaxID=161767 RepID=A0A3P8TM45_AMPPE